MKKIAQVTLSGACVRDLVMVIQSSSPPEHEGLPGNESV